MIDTPQLLIITEDYIRDCGRVLKKGDCFFVVNYDPSDNTWLVFSRTTRQYYWLRDKYCVKISAPPELEATCVVHMNHAPRSLNNFYADLFPDAIQIYSRAGWLAGRDPLTVAWEQINALRNSMQ